jgi:lysophospholipase L1-like esterase
MACTGWRSFARAATAVGAVTAAGAVCATTGLWRPPASVQANAAAAGGTALRVVVVGDSLSTGYGTSADLAWPSLLSDEEGGRVEVVNASENGDGYLAVGDDNGTFASHAAEAVDAEAQVVVFFGSENDMGADGSELGAAVGETLEAARSSSPKARIIVVGPPSYTAQPEPERVAVHDALEEAASREGADFVDPMAQGWFVGLDGMVGPDGVHPSVAGQFYLRDEMARALGL